MFFFFFNDTATTEIYTLSLHDALPISDTAAEPVTGRPRACPAGPRRQRRAAAVSDRPADRAPTRPGAAGSASAPREWAAPPRKRSCPPARPAAAGGRCPGYGPAAR